MAMNTVAILLLTLRVSSAFQLPFKLEVPFFKAKLALDDPEPIATTPRIAIIGAGAGGSSAAFWISKAQERFGADIEIDVYEKESYIGGRK
jgi:prenylcysteine oxidase/farnesylcysteine lyase